MSYLVLARKWRPQTFAEILGQEHVTRTLQNAIRAGRVAHAFLFTGVRGVGKTTAARVLAKALNCEQGPAPEPCNTCVHCQEIAAGTALDVVEIDGASNTGVDDVRAIIENVRYQPAKSRFKIYIVDEVHMLSTSAFNALLKTLEEPPAHVKFIFATTDPHKVPATIQSRCQRYDFKRLPLRLVAAHLAHIAKQEGIEITETGLFALARESEGSMRDAQSLLDQVIAFAGTRVADEQVLQVLGLADRARVLELADAVLQRAPERVLEVIDRVHTAGHDLRRFARDLVEHFRNLAVVHAGAVHLLASELPPDELEVVKRQAQSTSFLECERVFRTLVQAEAELGRSPLPKFTLEMHLLRAAMTEPLVSLAALTERLHELAGRAPGNSQREPAAPRPSTPSPAKTPRKSTVSGTAASSVGRPVAPAPVADDAPAEARASRENWNWDEFVEFVGKKRAFAAQHLQAATTWELRDGILRVTLPEGIHYRYFTDKGRAEELAQCAREFFGTSVNLKLEEQAGARTEEDEAEDASRGPAPRQAVLQHPAVQQAIAILGAEVREIHNSCRNDERGSV